MDAALEFAGRLPWGLIATLMLFPVLRRLGDYIHDAKWREVYLLIVADIERRYGAGGGEDKLTAAKAELAARSIPFNRQTLEKAVVLATKAG
ncbi:MAG: hypothetical protein ACYC63_10905 [Armatimonadota bacterium]